MKRMKRIISISIALLLAGSALADTYRVSYTLRGSGKKITIQAESAGGSSCRHGHVPRMRT